MGDDGVPDELIGIIIERLLRATFAFAFSKQPYELTFNNFLIENLQCCFYIIAALDLRE